ncbi:MAG: hypothetical protein V4643_12570 [Bacteroidota bacterium]
MKRIILIVFVLSITIQTNAQIKSGWGNLDYAVPESPAFKLLGTQPTNLLRPTSLRDISLGVGNYLINDNSGIIPKNLSIEIAPTLFSPNLNLNKYNKNKFLYRTKLSIGTLANQNGSYQIAGGINFTLIDKSDKRDLKNDFVKNILINHKASHENILKAVDLVFKSNMFPNTSKLEIKNAYEQSDSTKKQIINAVATELIKIDTFSVTDHDTLRNSWAKDNWNATIWQAGIGTKANFKDSIFKDITKKAGYGIWSTFGTHFCKYDQLLIGLSVLGSSDTTGSLEKPDASLGVRYYYGVNEIKGFLELEGKIASQTNDNFYTIKFGTEIRLEKGYWADLGFAFRNGSGETVFYPSFSIKYSLPDSEKK